MSNNFNSENNLDLWSWFDAVLKAKWIIAVLICSGGIGGYFFYFMSEDQYVVKAHIRPLVQFEQSELVLWRDLGLANYDELHLFRLFNRTVSDSNNLAAELDRIGVIPSTDLNEADYKNALLSFSNKISIEESLEETETSWSELRIRHEDLALAISIMKSILINANHILSNAILLDASENLAFEKVEINTEIERIERDISDLIVLHNADINDQIEITRIEIQELKDFHTLSVADEIYRKEKEIEYLRSASALNRADDLLDLELQLTELLNEYKKLKKDRMKFLSEQNEIAALLGIDQLYNLSTNVGDNSVVASIQNEDQPYFYRGTIAIEKEIKQIMDRDLNEEQGFAEGYRKLEREYFTQLSKQNKDEYVRGIRDLEIDLSKLEHQLEEDRYISGLRDLEHKINVLESRRDLVFVSGMKERQILLQNKRNDLEFKMKSDLLLESGFRSGETKLTSFDTEKLETENLRRSRVFMVFLGVVLGGSTGVMGAILRASYNRKDQRPS